MKGDGHHMKRGFYNEYEQAKAEKQRDQHYRERYRLSQDKPLIIETRQSTSVKVLGWLTDTLKRLGKLLLAILFFFLISVGLTAILNEPLREQIAAILNNLLH